MIRTARTSAQRSNPSAPRTIKRRVILAFFSVLLVSCVDPTKPVTEWELIPAFLKKQTNQTSLSAPEFVFPPEVFLRERAQSKETREFSTTGFVGPFILHAENASFVGSVGEDEVGGVTFGAKITLNGETVLKDGDFERTGSVNRVTVALEDDPSTLTVKLHGRPGSTLTIWIEGTKGAVVDQGLVSDPDGAWSLDFPAGALDQPITLTVKPPTGLPFDRNAIPGTAFEFGPDGTLFAVPVQECERAIFVPEEVESETICVHPLLVCSHIISADCSLA